MIKATGHDNALQLSIDGTSIAVLDHAKLGFMLNGQEYTVRRTGFFTPLYELLRDGEPLASAKQAPFAMRYKVTSAGRQWDLKPEQTFGKRFGLFDDATRVGGIEPASGGNYLRDVAIDLPATLPQEAQVFLMWLLLWKWSAAST